MKRTFTLIALFASQALVIAVAAILYFVTRPAIADICMGLGGRVPLPMSLALSSWFLPSLAAFAVACDLVALFLRKRSERNAAMGLGLVLPAFGVITAAISLFVPLFQLAPVP